LNKYEDIKVNIMQNSDETKKNMIFIEAMADAISDCTDIGIEDMRKELQADGINLDASVNNLLESVKVYSMDAKRESLDIAAETRQRIKAADEGVVGKFSDYSKDQLLACIKSLITPEEQVSLAYRGLNGKSVEDLVSILEDLEAAKNLRKKAGEGASDSFFCDAAVYQEDAPEDLSRNHDEYLYGDKK
jgi:hypothetical protein